MTSPENSDKNSKYSSIFLSYSQKDKIFVNKLAERFGKAGVNYWLDTFELKIGDSLIRKIGAGISEAEYFAIVLSKSSSASNWVQTELESAINKEIDTNKVVVLPILIEDVEKPHFLKHKLHADFTSFEKFEASFQALLDTLLIEDAEEPSSAKFYPNKFIPDLKFFVGRTQLLIDLKAQLDKTHRASIHDISGLGKTFSTYKFADLHQDNYEKIFFVRASKEEMTQRLAEMGVLLDPSLQNEPDQSKQALGFKNWLEENENWLVIYDNVDKPSELFPFVPLNKKGDCIFTSNFASIINLGKGINIDKLGEGDAKSLLFSRAFSQPHTEIKFDDDEERKAFENIIKEIDGLPVSLNTTGAFINKNAVSFAEFERKMKRTPAILVKNEDGFDKYQNQSALKAFSIAIDDISVKKPDDEFENSPELAQKLLFAIGFIAPDNIPEILLQMILQHITEIDFESEDNEDLWLEIRKKLFDYDLLKDDNKTFRTHRLIQKVIQLKPAFEEQKEIIIAVLSAIDFLFPFSEFGNWEECDLYLSHSIIIVKFAELLNLLSEKIARNYAKIGYHLRNRIQYQLAIEYLSRAIDEFQKLFGEESTNLGSCLNELALVYDSQGKYDEAIELYKQALRIDEKTVGKEHSIYAIRLNNLALVYESQGKYDEAIELLKQALIIFEKTLGKEHPNYANYLNNLASVYDSQGKYDKAVELYKQTLAIDEKTIGKKHPNYAISLGNLAKIYHKQKNFELAEKNNIEALKIFEESVSKLHPYYATCLNDLAIVYRSQNKYEKAIELFKQAIEIDEKTIGLQHPQHALRLSNLAFVYEKQEKVKEALDLFEEALKIDEKTLPENHPYTLQDRESVRRCREKLGKK